VNTRALKILVDTNIWIDYYTARDIAHGHSSQLIKSLLGSKHEVYACTLSTNDLFYLLQVYLKLAHRRQLGDSLSPEQALAIKEVAWKSTEHMIKVAKLIAVDTFECQRALALRETSNDYEDNLIIACALTCGVDYLVTNDESLQASKAVKVIYPDELYARLFER